jgi:hypothetical protein
LSGHTRKYGHRVWLAEAEIQSRARAKIESAELRVDVAEVVDLLDALKVDPAKFWRQVMRL